MMSRHTVLLVDDEPNLLAALRRGLRHEPYDIVAAESVSAALKILVTRPIDVVVSDQTMPDVTGAVFLEQVCKAYPDTIRIMLTGHASVELARRAINDGQVYRFFTKPCSTVELAIAIRQGLQQRALLLESRRLLHTVRRQSAALEELESEMHGITDVSRDGSGAIVLEDVPMDPVALLKEVEAELGLADERLRSRERETRRRGEQGPRGGPHQPT